MKTRIILGSIFIALISGIFYLDHIYQTDLGFCILAVLLMGTGVVELYAMAGLPKKTMFWGFLFTTLLQVAVWWDAHHSSQFMPAVLAGSMLLFFLFSLRISPSQEAFQRLSIAVLGVIYVGYMGSFFVRIRALPSWGESLLIYTVVASKGTDIFAYFTGSFLGRHKWIPAISPGKTWEGLFGGMLGAGGVGVLIWWSLGGEEIFCWYSVLVFSIMLGFLSQCGDLAESFIKRSLKKKDSSSLIPEFGGILDLIDCLLFTGPIVYFVWMFSV